MSRFNNILVLCLVITSCTLSAVHARRRSRIDLPIKNAADAPLEDNAAVETGNEDATASAVSAAQPTTVQADLTESNNDVSEISSSEELQDCDNIDNISFELITG